MSDVMNQSTGRLRKARQEIHEVKRRIRFTVEHVKFINMKAYNFPWKCLGRAQILWLTMCWKVDSQIKVMLCPWRKKGKQYVSFVLFSSPESYWAWYPKRRRGYLYGLKLVQVHVAQSGKTTWKCNDIMRATTIRSLSWAIGSNNALP